MDGSSAVNAVGWAQRVSNGGAGRGVVWLKSALRTYRSGLKLLVIPILDEFNRGLGVFAPHLPLLFVILFILVVLRRTCPTVSYQIKYVLLLHSSFIVDVNFFKMYICTVCFVNQSSPLQSPTD